MSVPARTQAHEHDEPPKGWQLVIMESSGSRRVDLPSAGTVRIGRGDDLEIQLSDGSISRAHAALHVAKTLQIEDLGSSNGTFVRGEAIAGGRRVDIAPGEFFEIGAVVCVVRGRVDYERLRSLRSHDYFEARLQDEVDRVRGGRGHLAVIRVRLAEDDDAAVAELMAAARPGDVVARYAPRDYELLVVDDRVAAGRDVAADVASRLARGDRSAALGLAVYPDDGRSAEALFAAACDDLLPPVESDGQIVITSPTMRKLHELLERVAAGGVNVLLLGETGVGKEVFAERLHQVSPRAAAPLMKINCAAVAPNLLESELFGHERGAFTGADRRKTGLLEAANGGVVFLDEVGELDAGAQAKLLRVIEDRRVRRVGGTDETPIDVIFVGATNRDLEAEVAAERFRADLYYRLNGFTLTIPPLRERREEILPLAGRFIAAAVARMGQQAPPALSPEAVALLEGYRWPGNIRELRNMMDRAVLLADGGVIGTEELPVVNLRAGTSGGLERAMVQAAGAGEAPADLTADERADRARIVEALAAQAGNQTRAAEVLGISRRWLSTKMARYKIPRPRKR